MEQQHGIQRVEVVAGIFFLPSTTRQQQIAFWCDQWRGIDKVWDRVGIVERDWAGLAFRCRTIVDAQDVDVAAGLMNRIVPNDVSFLSLSIHKNLGVIGNCVLLKLRGDGAGGRY